MNLRSDAFLSKGPTYMGWPTDVSDCLPSVHDISETTTDRVSGTKAKNHYNVKSEVVTKREKMADQDFWRQNDPMSQPPLDLTPLSTNTTNRTTSPCDSIPPRTKPPKPTPLTLPMDSPALPTDLPGDPDPDPSLSDSSKKSNLSNDTNSSKSKKNKRNKRKKRRKKRKDDPITYTNNARGIAIGKIIR